MERTSDQQTKIWLCGRCKSVFSTRWLLARHIKDVHNVDPKEANREAQLNEWWRVYNPNLIKIQEVT